MLKKHLKNKRLMVIAALMIVLVASGITLFIPKKAAAPTSTTTETKAATVGHTTELYFADEAKLPAVYSPGENIPVSFVMHNLEGEDKDYHFQVLVNGRTVADHTLHVKNKDFQNVNETFYLPKSSEKVTVEVKLLDQNKSIHFELLPK